MHDEKSRRVAIQGALIAAMAVWGLNVAAVKALTQSFDPTSGVMATAVANLIWNGAIARIGVARTAVFLYWVPVFGVAFAAVFLGEQLTVWHFAGFAAVMGGTYLGIRKPSAGPAISP